MSQLRDRTQTIISCPSQPNFQYKYLSLSSFYLLKKIISYPYFTILMSSPAAAKMSSLPTVKRQHLLAELYVCPRVVPAKDVLWIKFWTSSLIHHALSSSAGLKQACPQGIYVSLTPGDPTLWSGVIFVRKGPSIPPSMNPSYLPSHLLELTLTRPLRPRNPALPHLLPRHLPFPPAPRHFCHRHVPPARHPAHHLHVLDRYPAQRHRECLGC